jgi:hypothetical protein
MSFRKVVIELFRSRQMPWAVVFLSNYLYWPIFYLVYLLLPGTVYDPGYPIPGVLFLATLFSPISSLYYSGTMIVFGIMDLVDYTGGQSTTDFAGLAACILAWPISILMSVGVVRVVRKLWRLIRMEATNEN